MRNSYIWFKLRIEKVYILSTSNSPEANITSDKDLNMILFYYSLTMLLNYHNSLL